MDRKFCDVCADHYVLAIEDSEGKPLKAKKKKIKDAVIEIKRGFEGQCVTVGVQGVVEV